MNAGKEIVATLALLAILAALLAATFLGKWKFVDTDHYSPAIDL